MIECRKYHAYIKQVGWLVGMKKRINCQIMHNFWNQDETIFLDNLLKRVSSTSKTYWSIYLVSLKKKKKSLCSNGLCTWRMYQQEHFGNNKCNQKKEINSSDNSWTDNALYQRTCLKLSAHSVINSTLSSLVQI